VSDVARKALCRADSVPLNGMKRVVVEGLGPVCVYHIPAGYFATEDTCTHGLADLSDGTIEDGLVICPYHGGAFDIATGEPALAPCTEPLRTYRIELAGEDLVIHAAASA
jgi:nitrite reductase/ring-hydroxylating ferredoxin subunit